VLGAAETNRAVSFSTLATMARPRHEYGAADHIAVVQHSVRLPAYHAIARRLALHESGADARGFVGRYLSSAVSLDRGRATTLPRSSGSDIEAWPMVSGRSTTRWCLRRRLVGPDLDASRDAATEE